MTLQSLQDAMDEAARFVDKGVRAKARILNDYPNQNPNADLFASKQNAAVKRASLDLTRALSEMRK